MQLPIFFMTASRNNVYFSNDQLICVIENTLTKKKKAKIQIH
jgi:hypothetical protein